MGAAQWFLAPGERGNRASRLDARAAWTDGNSIEVLVDGATYFERLRAVMSGLEPGACFHFTDWQGDADERLDGEGSEFGRLLACLAERGVLVRGLLWRSHPRSTHFAEEDNLGLTKVVDRAGGEIFVDERVRRGGSHHQKLVLVHHVGSRDRDIAFVGGVDLCHGRRDTPEHLGDPQPVALAPQYGSRPPWHDTQIAVRGPVLRDLEETFRERWNDPTPLDHRNPWRVVMRHLVGQRRRPSPLPDQLDAPAPCGTHAVQVLRTYPAKLPRYPFAPDGERSIARAYLKAFRRARRLVYIEDQYLWSPDAAAALSAALRAHPRLRVIVVVPRFPDRDGQLAAAGNRVARKRVVAELVRAGGERVLVCDLENADGTPIYVHAKVCIVDDVWMTVGSDNLNRRSWTHDSELCCAIVDAELDGRAPRDPAALGDGARRLARETRLRLWREHLGRAAGDDEDLVDPDAGFAAFRTTAAGLDAWHRLGRGGERPPGRVRPHREDADPRWRAALATAMARLVADPDGRPRSLRRRNAF